MVVCNFRIPVESNCCQLGSTSKATVILNTLNFYATRADLFSVFVHAQSAEPFLDADFFADHSETNSNHLLSS
jgi:hypothetical protein